MKQISDELYEKLDAFGLLPNNVNASNVGGSNYAKHFLQPWAIWQDWNLNPWDADIVKRVLRTKNGDSRKMDYEKIIHICQERIRQIDIQEKYKPEEMTTIEKGKQYLCIKDFAIDEGDMLETLFTEGFYYNASDDGIIVSNTGLRASINKSVFNEHFKEIKE